MPTKNYWVYKRKVPQIKEDTSIQKKKLIKTNGDLPRSP